MQCSHNIARKQDCSSCRSQYKFSKKTHSIDVFLGFDELLRPSDGSFASQYEVWSKLHPDPRAFSWQCHLVMTLKSRDKYIHMCIYIYVHNIIYMIIMYIYIYTHYTQCMYMCIYIYNIMYSICVHLVVCVQTDR